MQKYEVIQKLSSIEFRRLTGVRKETFVQMTLIVRAAAKQMNRNISSERALNENVIGRLKRFIILGDRYRNRRKRFGLRFNLIAGIQNWELKYDNSRSFSAETNSFRP